MLWVRHSFSQIESMERPGNRPRIATDNNAGGEMLEPPAQPGLQGHAGILASESAARADGVVNALNHRLEHQAVNLVLLAVLHVRDNQRA